MSHRLPLSFLTGKPFNPNKGEIKQQKVKKPNSKLSKHEIFSFMNKKNKIFFEQEKWLTKRKVQSKPKEGKARNDNIHLLNQLVENRKKGTSSSIPTYLRSSKMRVCIEKEYKSLVDDQNNLPKGVEVIDEKEKSDLLLRLRLEKESLISKLHLLPVSINYSSYGMRLLKINLDRKLKEIDYSIQFLSVNEPFRLIKTKNNN